MDTYSILAINNEAKMSELTEAYHRQMERWNPLNYAYDKDLFALVAQLLGKIMGQEFLTAENRQRLLKAFRDVNHEGDSAFLGALTQMVADARYQAAARGHWERNMSRMYGGTRDLRGALPDTRKSGGMALPTAER